MAARKLRVKERGITLIELDAWYQYLIDHTQATPAGLKVIPFMLPPKEELHRRVLGRLTGLYREEEETMMKKSQALMNELYFNRSFSHKHTLKASVFQNGNIYRRAVFAIYQALRRHIFDT